VKNRTDMSENLRALVHHKKKETLTGISNGAMNDESFGEKKLHKP
jgi:hypothetical protein